MRETIVRKEVNKIDSPELRNQLSLHVEVLESRRYREMTRCILFDT